MFIYYVMPEALVTGNSTLFVYVLLVVFIGYFLGLTILALNLQGLMLWFLQTVLCFWEKKSMNILIRKNLMVHKKRNNLTAIIYSLTLGTVIFMLMQLKSEYDLTAYLH